MSSARGKGSNGGEKRPDKSPLDGPRAKVGGSEFVILERALAPGTTT